MRFSCILSIILVFKSILLFGQEYTLTHSYAKAISFEASYIGDGVYNMLGGIKQGTAYLGMVNLQASFNTETAGIWKGGEFHINWGNTHGDEPSTELTGDFKHFTNIEAGELNYLYEFWYKQSFGLLIVTAGLQDLNSEYANSDYGGLFLNSSFGIHSTISENIPAPVFPLSRVGLNLTFYTTDKFRVKTAVFEGLHAESEGNDLNTNFFPKNNEGNLYILEIESTYSMISGYESTYKGGCYVHQKGNSSEYDSNSVNSHKCNLGYYCVIDQKVYNNKGREGGIGLFAQVGLSSSGQNNHYGYFGGGIHYSGISKKRGNDLVGLAVAHSRFKTSLDGNETSIEANYKAYLTKNIFLQPDLQYIINPSGTEEVLDNVLVGIIRFGIDF